MSDKLKYRYVYICDDRGVLEREDKVKDLKLEPGDKIALSISTIITNYYRIRNIDKIYNVDKNIIFYLVYMTEISTEESLEIEDLL